MPSSAPISQCGTRWCSARSRRDRSPRPSRTDVVVARRRRRERRATGVLGMRSSRSRSSAAASSSASASRACSRSPSARLSACSASASSTSPSRRRAPTSLESGVDPGPQVVALGGQLALAARRARAPGRAAAGPSPRRASAGAHRVEVGADPADVEHGQQRSKPPPAALGPRLGAAERRGGSVRRGAADARAGPRRSRSTTSPIRYGDHVAVDGLSLPGRAGRGRRAARAERRRQDLDRRDARGLPPADRRARCGCSGSTPSPTTPS